VIFNVVVTSYEDAVRRLLLYQVDLALVFGAASHPDLASLLRVDQPLVAVMAQDHALARHPSLTLAQCLAHKLALLDPTQSGRRMIEAAAAARAIAPRIALESNSFELLCDYVAATDAITFQAAIGTSFLPARQRLAVRPISDEDHPHAPLVLLHLKGRALPPAATRFARQLLEGLVPAVVKEGSVLF
jgi:DNA-binding transcriptional LysR family regulator